MYASVSMDAGGATEKAYASVALTGQAWLLALVGHHPHDIAIKGLGYV